MGNTTNIHRKVLLFRLCMLSVIAILSHRVILAFLMSRQVLGENGSIEPVGMKWLFIPVISVVGFMVFWKVLRLEYIMLVSGLLLVFFWLYDSLSLPFQVINIIQTIGLILYLIAVIRIAIFLIRPKSDKFIEALLKKS